jgi:hypothetical protein
MKGCGLRNLRKYSFCIDGIGKDQKLCKEYIDNDKSGRTWIKKVNKTSKFYDSNKDCNSGSERYKDNYEECHDLEDSNTWDIVKSKRNEYYSIENIDCTKTGQGFLEGNEEYCKWIKATENDSLDCQGTVFRTYKCVDDSGKTVTTNRCNLANKPTEKVVLGLTCDIKPTKWMNNTGVKDSAETACNVCGVAEGQILSRNNKCIRSDGVEIGLANCTGELASVKQCNQTEDCKCKCTNGKGYNKNECNSLLGFSDIKEGEVTNICKSCNWGYKLTSDPVKIPYFENKKFKFSDNLKKCKLRFLESKGTANEGIREGFYYYFEYNEINGHKICMRKTTNRPKKSYGIDGKYTKYWKDQIFEKYLTDDNVKGIVFSKEYVPEKATYKKVKQCARYFDRRARNVQYQSGWNVVDKNILETYVSPYIKASAWAITNDCFDESKEEVGERKFDNRSETFYTHLYPKKFTVAESGRNIKLCRKNICLCDNGTPVNLCEKDGTKECQACNDGYYLFNKKCVKNKNATCNNGTPAKGNNLLVEDKIENCQKCNSGFSISNIKKSQKLYNQEKVYTNIRTGYDPKTDSNVGSLNKETPSITRSCIANEAKCKIIKADGVSVINNKYAAKLGDPKILYNGIYRCGSCPEGFALKDDGKEAHCYQDDKCSCPNGTSVLRSKDGFGESGCPIGAKYGCRSCNTGFELIKNYEIRNYGGDYKRFEYVKQGPICIKKNYIRYQVKVPEGKSCSEYKYHFPVPKEDCTREEINWKEKDPKTANIFRRNFRKIGKTTNHKWPIKGCAITDLNGNAGQEELRFNSYGENAWPWIRYRTNDRNDKKFYYGRSYKLDKLKMNWTEGDSLPSDNKIGSGIKKKYKFLTRIGSNVKINPYKWGWRRKTYWRWERYKIMSRAPHFVDRENEMKYDALGICKVVTPHIPYITAKLKKT